uniref:Ribosomal protein S3 n=1 Tax=Balamuthia mandrillaris TaxID=66527 RepID=A0A0K1HRP3_9EUKA|nr:ribosomal protein S3 [Balamuthia mandrillaris]AKT94916.1 ribosomal protein S3 [Balamuthia mandrillaris]
MGHVVNPISHRIYATFFHDKIWHVRYPFLYSFVYFKLALAHTYASQVLNLKRFRTFSLESDVRLMFHAGTLNVIILFYSSTVANLLLSLKEKLASSDVRPARFSKNKVVSSGRYGSKIPPKFNKGKGPQSDFISFFSPKPKAPFSFSSANQGKNVSGYVEKNSRPWLMGNQKSDYAKKDSRPWLMDNRKPAYVEKNPRPWLAGNRKSDYAEKNSRPWLGGNRKSNYVKKDSRPLFMGNRKQAYMERYPRPWLMSTWKNWKPDQADWNVRPWLTGGRSVDNRGSNGRFSQHPVLPVPAVVSVKQTKQKERISFGFFRWFVYLVFRNYFLFHSLYYLKMMISRDLNVLLSVPVDVSLAVIPQEVMSANAWATFIKYKLKRKTHFSKIMSTIVPIWNRMLRYNLLGYKVSCNGRMSRRGRASSFIRSRGKFPFSAVVSFVSYGFTTVVLKNSICGIKVWLFFKKNPKLLNSPHVFFV